LSDAALATVTKERDTALAANEAIQSDYQAKLSATIASTADLAQRLRNAESRLAASSRPVPQAGSGQQSSSPSQNASVDSLNEAIAAVIAESKANSAQLNALVAQVKPQQ
jgi:hypothetical protein